MTSLNGDTDITADDAGTRRAGRDFLKRYVNTPPNWVAVAVGRVVQKLVFTPRYLSPDERALRRGYTVEALAELGPFARSAGVRVAIEPLSRFHTSLVNTAADGRGWSTRSPTRPSACCSTRSR